VPPSPSSINVCERDVCHHKSDKEMASVLVRESFQNIHRPKEPQHTALTNNTNTRTKEMDNKLQGYDFQIIYKPGKNSVVADALSRQEPPTLLVLLVVSSPIRTIFKELQQFFTTTEGTNLL